jgi:hypothetical protein
LPGESWRAAFPSASTPVLLAFAPVPFVRLLAPLASIV